MMPGQAQSERSPARWAASKCPGQTLPGRAPAPAASGCWPCCQGPRARPVSRWADPVHFEVLGS